MKRLMVLLAVALTVTEASISEWFDSLLSTNQEDIEDSYTFSPENKRQLRRGRSRSSSRSRPRRSSYQPKRRSTTTAVTKSRSTYRPSSRASYGATTRRSTYKPATVTKKVTVKPSGKKVVKKVYTPPQRRVVKTRATYKPSTVRVKTTYVRPTYRA